MTAVLPMNAHGDRLAAVADKQASVLTRRQLHDAGWPDHRIRSQLDARRWQAVGPVVVVLHNGPLGIDQQRWAAVLNAGPGAALCGRTAATVEGLSGFEDARIHVIVRRGERPPSLPGIEVKVHESRRYVPDRDLRPNRVPPRLRLERSLVDAAAWTRRPRPACGILVNAVQQRLTVPGRLLDAVRDAGQVRHRRLMRLVLADVAGGAQALSEVDFARFGRRHGLPPPIRQAVRLDGRGRRRYLDAEFVRPDGTRFGVEIDGAIHLIVGTYWADCERSNELVIAGEMSLRFPSVAMYISPAEVADQLRRMLHR